MVSTIGIVDNTAARCPGAIFMSSVCVAAIIAAAPLNAYATDSDALTCEAGVQSCTVGGRVFYTPEFFAQYNPNNARDMVDRVPGFSIDGGDDVRGFGGAAGNVLIDGQRPSTKSADIYQLLERIGAENVERIELIRGGTGALDVGGQAVVVNVVRKSGAQASSSTPWEAYVGFRHPNGSFYPGGKITHSGKLGGVDYTIGIRGHATEGRFPESKFIQRFNGDGVEIRRRDIEFRNPNAGGNINFERAFDNGDVARLNFETVYFASSQKLNETRFFANGGPNLTRNPFKFEHIRFEIGADYERNFSDDFSAKFIALANRGFEDLNNQFSFLPKEGADQLSIFTSENTIGEVIGRIEFDVNRWNRHAIQFGGEIAHNFIDSSSQFFFDDGSGELEELNIPGANTRVAELRGEPFMRDSWSVHEKLTVDIGVAVELSRIAQTGDTDNRRFFVYPKPSISLTYSPTENTQWRLSGERTVNQLSFGQFVSSVNFSDEDVDFGNPELQPQRVWEFEAEFEKRFGDIGVLSLTGLYHYVNDVEDLLPLGGVIEVPGNIGNGTIWGGVFNLTIPLDWIGIRNARLESAFAGRKSNVVDPVTGLDREFSFIAPYEFSVEFRHDAPAKKLSWGWEVSGEGKRRDFGLDEVTINIGKPEMEIFVETTALKGVKTRFSVGDVFNQRTERDRTVFKGSRALNNPRFREFQLQENGRRFQLTFSGAF